jgi:pyruvate, water dikinase
LCENGLQLTFSGIFLVDCRETRVAISLGVVFWEAGLKINLTGRKQVIMGLWKKIAELIRSSRAFYQMRGKGREREWVMFQKRYSAFRNLLDDNNRVLELMADMEEKRAGEYLFDKQYVEGSVDSASAGVAAIIKSLNSLSGGRYNQLQGVYREIQQKIAESLSHAGQIPAADYCIPISDLTADMVRIAGGKMASLGELSNRLGIPVPDGFCITSSAFKRFIEHNDLGEEIRKHLASLGKLDMESMNATSLVVREMIRASEVPDDIRQAVEAAVRRLRGDHLDCMTAVRSSAVHEDGAFSFAGQYMSFLNVPEDQIIDRYKEVIASLFCSRAIFYFKTKGFCEADLVMAAGVLRMIPAVAGGVLYTKDPNNPAQDRAIINAVFGIGSAAVDGSVHPDSYVVSLAEGAIIEERRAVDHNAMLVCLSGGGIDFMAVPQEMKGKSVLSREQLRDLCRLGLRIEEHFCAPQDIEWAIGPDNSISILQARPLRVFGTGSVAKHPPRSIAGRKKLLDKGLIACKGIAFGKAYVLRNEEDLNDFPDGAVLVARHTSTRFVTVMDRAAAIITDVGGAAGHMASLSREYQVPTIVDAAGASTIISHGCEITVDAVNCTVYEGLVEELRPFAIKKREPFKETHLFMMFEQVLRWITPLNLVDPDSPGFKPEACRTFHDITRFSHEKAMAELFSIGSEYEESSDKITLAAGIPISAHILDIEGGVRPGISAAKTKDILSLPFIFFLKGMQGMKWPEPRLPDVKGFLGMIAHTASIPEHELRQTAKKSFAVLSGNYMNFSIRLGYHFSQVEAYVGDNLNDNYISFFFSGGGAVRSRRLSRVRLIRELLEKIDFRVKVAEDVIKAVLLKYPRPEIELRLEIMGRLTAYTKQLDMALFNDAVTDWYIEEFYREHIEGRITAPHRSPVSS